MKSLLSGGADVNGRDDKMRTVLMVAIDARNKDAAELLIDNGADLYARNGDKMQANAIFYAIAHYDLAMMSMLLDKKFDPNHGPCHGKMTPLMWAANLGKKDLCEELARRGADINAKQPDKGWTAMDYARNNLKPHIADRLMEIDAENKAIAAREAEEEKQRQIAAKLQAIRAEFDAICNAGLPIQKPMKVKPPLALKPGAKK